MNAVPKVEKIPKPAKAFWTADCETDPFDGETVPRPFIWGLYNGYEDKYWEFTREEDFIDFVTQNRVIVYAHNGGKFDWHFITRFMPDKCEPLLINGRLSRFYIGKCEFRDSYNLISQPLRNFLKEEFDYDKMHARHREKYMDEIRHYLRSDCVNLWEVIQQFRDEYGLHLTQAGAAMDIWQKHFKPKEHKGSDWRQKKPDFSRLRPYYYGGRVQCFQYGDRVGSASSVDINSAYPFAMLHEHPFGRPLIVGEGDPPKELVNQSFLTVRAVNRGAFPLKCLRGRTYYPADDRKRTYSVTGWEWNAALETGTVEDYEILEYVACEGTINFRSYVDHFWKLRAFYKQRLRDDPSDYEAKWKENFCKIFLNALYGKFGADIERYKRHFFYSPKAFEEIKDKLDDETDYYRFNEWIVLRKPKDEESEQRYYHVGTAASITGFVRAHLWKAICASKTPLYCDTDAICAVGFPRGSIKLGNDLGEWGVEGEYDRVCIGGKKLYAYHFSEEWRASHPKSPEWKARSKGVRLTAEEIVKVVQGETMHYHPQAPTFKLRGNRPEFIARDVTMTADDTSRIPEKTDPEIHGYRKWYENPK